MRITLTIDFNGIDPDSEAAEELFDGRFSPAGLEELKNIMGADYVCIEDAE